MSQSEEAQKNQERFPICAAFINEVRRLVGADQVKVIYVEENGQSLGTSRSGFIPLDTTGAIAAEVNRQRTAIAGYACDRTGMVMPARCGDCLCWEADEKRAVNRQRRGR